jgi:hypothetical protein
MNNIEACTENRCIGYNKNNKKCRVKTKNNTLFCSPCHEPLNREIIDNGCCICMEIIKSSNDIIYFRCKHAFHKNCYFEWLSVSIYENPICMICRNEIDFLKPKILSTSNKYGRMPYENMNKINNISNLLLNNKINNNK